MVANPIPMISLIKSLSVCSPADHIKKAKIMKNMIAVMTHMRINLEIAFFRSDCNCLSLSFVVKGVTTLFKVYSKGSFMILHLIKSRYLHTSQPGDKIKRDRNQQLII